MSNYVLVTGGAGYIGSHTCKALSQAGITPVVYDNLIYGHRELVRWGPFEYGDILDSNRLAEVFQRYSPSAVVHFAAFAYVGESVGDPGKYYRNNVTGTINLLEVMRLCECKRIIFSSTCATFGRPATLPITEKTPQRPINPYGRSKLMIERILEDYDHAYDCRSIVLRYFNAAGADPNLETGEKHQPETHLIPLAIQATATNMQTLEIFGRDYDTPDGTPIRDYIHVTDLADAHLKAMQYLQKSNISDQFNLGTGRGVSVQEIVDQVRAVTGKTVHVSYGKRRPGDPPMLVADPTRAKEVLAWKPSYSDIATIIDSAYRWYRKGTNP